MRRNYNDDDNIVKDGESVKVSVMMMDAAQRYAAAAVAAGSDEYANHRPGFRDSAVAAVNRMSARDEFLRKLQDAWKADQTEPDEPPKGKITNFKVPNPDEPDDPVARNEKMRQAQPDDVQQAQDRRQRAAKSYADQLSNNWRSKTGTADPNSANQVERQRRSWHWQNESGKDGGGEAA